MPIEVEEYVFEELEEDNKEQARDEQPEKEVISNAKNHGESSEQVSLGAERTQDGVSLSKEDIRKELEAIIETTKKQALEEARIIKEQAKKEGFELGYKEGYEKGLKDAKDVFDKTIDEYTKRMQVAIEKLIATTKEISKKYEELENVATDMVLDIAKKVISDELKTNRDVINSMVKDAIGLADSKKLKIKLNPDDAAHLNRDTIDGSKDVEIIKDDSLNKGSIIIEEDNGNIIDASVDTKLKQIRDGLVNE